MTYFQDAAAAPEWLDRIDAIRAVLTSGALAYGSLAAAEFDEIERLMGR
jgi:hypothetical protein